MTQPKTSGDFNGFFHANVKDNQDFNLSEKIEYKEHKEENGVHFYHCLPVEDVAEFVRRLKEWINSRQKQMMEKELSLLDIAYADLLIQIDKLVGEKMGK